MNYLLDTNICIYFIKDKDLSLKKKIQTLRSSVYLSSITAAELWHGVFKSSQLENNARNLKTFLSRFEIIPFDGDSAWIYGQLLAASQKSGKIIGKNDLLIACQAIQTESTLVTNNVREFSMIPGLKIENWTHAT